MKERVAIMDALQLLARIGVISDGIYICHLTIAELRGLNSDPLHFSAGGVELVAKTCAMQRPWCCSC